MESAEEKLSFLANNPANSLSFDEVQPDKTHNWVNLTNNDFETLLPLASKETKAAKTAGNERAIFKLFGFGVSTNRDEWIYDDSQDALARKMSFLVSRFDAEKSVGTDTEIKWSRNLKRRHEQGKREPFDRGHITKAAYRPYCSTFLYDSRLFIDELGIRESLPSGEKSKLGCIVVTDPTAQKPWLACAVSGIPDLHFVGAAAGGVCLPFAITTNEHVADNITDWALKQFRQHYEAPSPQPSPASGRGSKAQKINKEAIFHYCYAVLHDPLYREKYALNLKREFPRIPFYADFWQWAAWGEALMALHIGYEAVEPFALNRTDIPDEKSRAAGLHPKAILRADKDEGSITLDSETVLRGIPPQAWNYKLGNRCSLEWVLDQYKEKKPKDPTIREKFDTYRFADYKEKVIDLLMRVTTVSVETEHITQAMKIAPR
jgi:predicted helicase